jgi:putative ABC transport system permease protein
METIDISLSGMLLMYALLAVPLAIFRFCGLRLGRETLASVLRMTVQLVLVGIYLKYIFELNRLWIIGLWITVMLLVANWNVLEKARLRRRPFFPFTLVGITAGTLAVTAYFVFLVLRPTPFYDARYLIPITGMILGNCLRGNVISLERFYSGIRKNQKEFVTYLMMGAALPEAVRPYLRDALQAAVSPMLATVATMGIVSLPGMMTGQILGGAFPVVAIKYQIAIMICIFTVMTASALLNILLSMKIAFNPYHVLREDIFPEGRG